MQRYLESLVITATFLSEVSRQTAEMFISSTDLMYIILYGHYVTFEAYFDVFSWYCMTFFGLARPIEDGTNSKKTSSQQGK